MQLDNFTNSIEYALRNYANFKDRARRAQFWWFVWFSTLMIAGTAFLDIVLFGFNRSISPFNWSVSLALLVPFLAISTRRLHDIGQSGWLQLLALLPLLGMIVLIVKYCEQGDGAPNKYGDT